MDRLNPAALMNRLNPARLINRWNTTAILNRLNPARLINRMNFGAIMDRLNPASLISRLNPAVVMNRLNPAIENAYQVLDPSAPVDDLTGSIMNMRFIHHSGLVVPQDMKNFECLPSLQGRCIMAFVVEVFKQNAKFTFRDVNMTRKDKWDCTVNTDEIVDKIKAFPLPTRFETQLMEALKYVEYNSTAWLVHFANVDHANFNHFDWSTACTDSKTKWQHTKLREMLVFTSYGEIDDEKTVMEIIKREKIRPVDSFRLFCIYCIEDMIWKYWPHVNYHFIPLMDRILEQTPDRYIIPDRVEVVYFSCSAIAKDKRKGIESIRCPCELTRNWFVYLFNSTFVMKNLAGVRYFAQKLHPSKKQQTLNQVLDGMFQDKYEIEPLIFFVILTHLDARNKLKLFKSHPRHVAGQFINYPLVRSFMVVLELAQPYFMDRDFGAVLYMLMYYSKINEQSLKKHYENPFPDLLTLIWDRGPPRHQKYFIDQSILYILRRLACDSPRHKLKHEYNAQRKERYAIDYWKTEKKLRVIFQDRNILLDYLMWERNYRRKDRLRKVLEMHIPPDEMDEDIKEFLSVYEDSFDAL